MMWLRPENVVWDAVASHLVGEALRNGGRIADIGIGNGYFSFMTLGGRFKKAYDWYYNSDPRGFWKNLDIYDHLADVDIASFVDVPASQRIHQAIDLKPNLLAQVGQLGIADELLVADANEDFALAEVDTIFSNILYWLDSPFEVLKRLSRKLSSGGRLVLLFPNRDFVRNCRSYARENTVWTRINRGRADTLMWTMDLAEFRTIIARETELEVERATRYVSHLTLQTWDLGFRPFSPHLIKMANSLSPETRLEIKEEWCSTAMPFVEYLLENELENGPREGGFNFVVLRKS